MTLPLGMCLQVGNGLMAIAIILKRRIRQTTVFCLPVEEPGTATMWMPMAVGSMRPVGNRCILAARDSVHLYQSDRWQV